MKKPTLKDVAKEAGVSAGMVSRVINNYGYFSQETKTKVLKAVKKLSYRMNATARALKVKQTHVIGVLVSDFVSFFWTTLVRGIEQVANRAGYHIILCNTDENEQKGKEYLSTLLERNIDGLIVSPVLGTQTELRRLSRDGLPLVLVDRSIRGLEVPCITVDNEAGSFEAVDYLIKLGHRRVGIVSGIRGIMTSEERLAGYTRAFKENGLSIDERLIVEGEFVSDKTHSAVLKLLGMKPSPTAIFVCNEPMTIGVLLALKEKGIRVPTEMSLIGFDDPIWASITQPALTAVDQPSYSMGVLACEALIQRIRERDQFRISKENIVLKPKLVIRESCRKLKA
jgi:LacI family transcriptional regulator